MASINYANMSSQIYKITGIVTPAPHQVYMDDKSVKKIHIGNSFFLLSREGWGESKIPFHQCESWTACRVLDGKCHFCGKEAPPNLDMVVSLSKYKE